MKNDFSAETSSMDLEHLLGLLLDEIKALQLSIDKFLWLLYAETVFAGEVDKEAFVWSVLGW